MHNKEEGVSSPATLQRTKGDNHPVESRVPGTAGTSRPMPPYLDRLGISPHHALAIALPDKVHFPPCPYRWDAQLHLKPACLPPGREQAATSALREICSQGKPHFLRASKEKLSVDSTLMEFKCSDAACPCTASTSTRHGREVAVTHPQLKQHTVPARASLALCHSNTQGFPLTVSCWPDRLLFHQGIL